MWKAFVFLTLALTCGVALRFARFETYLNRLPAQAHVDHAALDHALQEFCDGNGLEFWDRWLANQPVISYGLPDELHAAIYAYSYSCSGPINHALRAGGTRALAVAPLAQAINEGLRRLPGYDGMAFRGTTLPPTVLRTYRVGATITEPAFLSTSQSRPFPGCHQFVIDSRDHGKAIADLAATNSENEVLFPSGSRFKVTRVGPGEPDPSRCAAEITQIEMQAL